MTTTHPGAFRHDLVLHEGTAQLVDLVAPFLRDGAAVGDPAVVLGDPDFVDALASATPDLHDLHLVREREAERYAGRELHQARQLLAELDGTGRQVRIVNQMPASTVEQWHEWRRYEAAANLVLAPYRAWGKCAHDTRRLDAAMLTDLRATHAYVETPDGCRPNPAYDEAGAHTRFLDVEPHPVTQTEPVLFLVDPSAAEARRAVRELALAAGLPQRAQETAILATSEAVANAWTHGRAPVLVRAWTEHRDGPAGEPRADRVTVAVSDSGPGPHPLVGLLPEAAGPSGRGGMWMVHVLVRDLHHRVTVDGYTLTFSVASDPADLPHGG